MRDAKRPRSCRSWTFLYGEKIVKISTNQNLA
nr:MAG TPA: hypothetical protein [Caudoviricetes sp.]